MKNELPSKECLEYLNYEEELTYFQIGLLYGVTKHAIYQWFKKRGVVGKNNQKQGFPTHSKELIKQIADKNRKFIVTDYKGKSELLNPQLFQNVQSVLDFRCECGNLFSRVFYTALKSKIGNVCDECKANYLSEKYSSEYYQEKFKQINGSRKTYRRSKAELELHAFIETLVAKTNYTVKHTAQDNNRSLDSYIPELNLYVEYNGHVFHSEMLCYVFNKHTLKYTQTLHVAKLKAVYPKQMLIVWEDDWRDRKDIVKKHLEFLIVGPKKRIYARNTELKQISSTEANSLYEKNHLQGSVRATISYGLFDKQNNLVACASFTKRKTEFELVRYCTDCHVVGGFSKLMKHFVENNECTKLYSFADLCFVNQDNNVYTSNGWIKDKFLEADYKYIVRGTRYHKFGFRRKHLKNKLKNYDPKLSEYENCLNHKIYRIWDCGKIKYSYPLSS